MSAARPARVTLVMPTFNEAAFVEDCLVSVVEDPDTEVLVVDGGSTDGTARVVAEQPGVRLVPSARGRARQMNAGARAATGDVLLFLHADTELPADALAWVRVVIMAGAAWGRFDVRLSGHRRAFRVIERMMNWRTAATGIVTGDQALYVRRDVFHALGGFAPIELMEDIELSTRLKWFGRPARIRAPVVTSSRRWETHGIMRTVVRMWLLRLLYALGVPPRRLARWYK